MLKDKAVSPSKHKEHTTFFVVFDPKSGVGREEKKSLLFSSNRSNKIWSLLIIGAALIVSSNFHTEKKRGNVTSIPVLK